MAEHPLKKHEERLAKHVAEGWGHSKESHLREAVDNATVKAHDNYHRADPEYNPEATYYSGAKKSKLESEGDRHSKAARKYETIADHMHEAKEAIKAYGQGHDMIHHGEGKPHKGK